MAETALSYDYPQDASPEKIWAILQETDRLIMENIGRRQSFWRCLFGVYLS